MYYVFFININLFYVEVFVYKIQIYLDFINILSYFCKDFFLFSVNRYSLKYFIKKIIDSIQNYFKNIFVK